MDRSLEGEIELHPQNIFKGFIWPRGMIVKKKVEHIYFLAWNKHQGLSILWISYT